MKTELQIPSDLKFLAIVEDWLLQSLKLELPEMLEWEMFSSRMKLVLVEAFSNVVRHAHAQQPHLPVVLRLEVEPNCLYLKIWDYGQGYDIKSYIPPEPEVKSMGGYGWMILTRLTDRVEYQLQGDGRNCLEMEVQLEPLPTLTSGVRESSE